MELPETKLIFIYLRNKQSQNYIKRKNYFLLQKNGFQLMKKIREQIETDKIERKKIIENER